MSPRRSLRPSAELALAALFTLITTLIGWSGRLPDDEGYLTFIGASVVARAPLAGIFFQKIHPAISILYAPFAALGWRAFVLAHASASGLAVYLLGRLARDLGVEAAWLPPLLLACSPLYLVSAATGHSNGTAVLFFVAALSLAQGSSRAALAAGAIAGFGLWSRYEQAPYLLALVAFDLAQRRRAHVLVGFASSVALYLLLGALYHRNPLWIVARPPVMPREVGPSTMGDLGLTLHNAQRVLEGFAMLTPAALTAALALPRGASPTLRWLAPVLALALGAQLALPQLGRLFNYDYTARYFLCHLPALALLAGAAGGGARGASWRALVLAACGVALALATLRDGFTSVSALALFAIPLAAQASPRPALTLAAAAALGVALAPSVGLRHSAALPLPGLEGAVTAALRAPPGVAVYTNAHQLQALIARRGSARRVRFLVGHDIVNELGTELGGRRSAQSDAVFRALGPVLYGDVLWPCEFPHAVAAGSLLVLARRERAEAVYDLRTWIGAARSVRDEGEVSVWRVERPVVVPRRPPPPWMRPETLALPCATMR